MANLSCQKKRYTFAELIIHVKDFNVNSAFECSESSSAYMGFVLLDDRKCVGTGQFVPNSFSETFRSYLDQGIIDL